MDKASMDEVNAAVAEQEATEADEDTSTSQEETTDESQDESVADKQPVYQGVPQSRVDQIVAEREAVKAEKAILEQQLQEVRDLEAKGYSIKDIQEYIASTGNSKELDAMRSKREAAELRKSVTELKDKAELNEYLANNPEHKSFSKALSGLKMANPHKSYEQLYLENFSQINVPVKKQKIRVETGRGSIEQPISKVVNESKFSKMSLNEQREYLEQHGGIFPEGGRL